MGWVFLLDVDGYSFEVVFVLSLGDDDVLHRQRRTPEGFPGDEPIEPWGDAKQQRRAPDKHEYLVGDGIVGDGFASAKYLCVADFTQTIRVGAQVQRVRVVCHVVLLPIGCIYYSIYLQKYQCSVH